MPYLHQRLTPQQAREMGVKFAEVTWGVVVTVEWWASLFKDPGPDYNLFKAIDKDGVTIEVVREEGY